MAKAPSLRKDRNKGTLRTRRLYTENAPWSKGNGKGRFKGNTWRTIEGAEPCEVKASSTVLNGEDEETGRKALRLVLTQLVPTRAGHTRCPASCEETRYDNQEVRALLGTL